MLTRKIAGKGYSKQSNITSGFLKGGICDKNENVSCTTHTHTHTYICIYIWQVYHSLYLIKSTEVLEHCSLHRYV